MPQSQCLASIISTEYNEDTKWDILSALTVAFIVSTRDQSFNMSQRLNLQTSNLPSLSEDALSATASPARGKEMRAALFAKLRPPPLRFAWEFWHDRQDRKTTTTSSSAGSDTSYESRLVPLATITDIREFWQLFNNWDVSAMALRDSVHLFHKGVKPVWEDARNARGGCWTFRVPKDRAPEFWQAVCVMAISEELQDAVAQPASKLTFIDDICGVSLSVRFTSFLVQVWNRDAGHTEGIQRILETVVQGLPVELRPKEGSYFYKRHSEHAGFRAPVAAEAVEEAEAAPDAPVVVVEQQQQQQQQEEQ